MYHFLNIYGGLPSQALWVPPSTGWPSADRAGVSHLPLPPSLPRPDTLLLIYSVFIAGNLVRKSYHFNCTPNLSKQLQTSFHLAKLRP